MKTNKVVASANFIRLLLIHMLLNLLQSRDSIKDLCSDPAKKVLSEYQLNIVRDLEKLHNILLPEDKDLGSLDIVDYESEDQSL